jgi:hypothetical protein
LGVRLSFEKYWETFSYDPSRKPEKLVPECWYRSQVAKIESCFLIRNVRYLVLDILVQTKSVATAERFEEALMPVMYELKALGADINVTCECWGI